MTIVHGRKECLPPRLSYDLELGVQAVVLDLIQRGVRQKCP